MFGANRAGSVQHVVHVTGVGLFLYESSPPAGTAFVPLLLTYLLLFLHQAQREP